MREIGWRSVGTAVVEWAAGGDGSGAEEVFGGGSQGFARGWWPGRTVVVGWGVAVGDGSGAEEVFGGGPQGVARGCRLGRTVVVEWAAGGDGSGAEEGAG